MQPNAAQHAALESQNTGKLYARMLADEMPSIVDVFPFFGGVARVTHGPLAGEYRQGATSFIRRDPIGVVAGIAPWNYPC